MLERRPAELASGELDMLVRTTGIDPHHVSFARPKGCELREPLNRFLLRRLNGKSGWKVTDHYLPESRGR